ncbi:MAG: hypothetical protein O3C40_27225 [Planctomycetota bacterium]|nr:hypothetical protein [Planctomycetota bacterium]
MKRLWMRLGVVAGILGVGGAGVLVAQKGGLSTAETEVASATEAPTVENGQPRPIPLGDPSFSTGDTFPASPAATTKVAVYSNELGPEEASSSARFVDPPASSKYAPPQYASSPAVYSVNDTETDLAPIPNPYSEAAPESSDAPSSSYAGRYGDPVGDEESAGTSLRTPQALAEPASQYGGYAAPAAEYETPARPAPMKDAAPQLKEAVPDDPQTYQDAVPVASKDATIEPPPLRREAVPAPSSYAPSYAAVGSSASIAAVVPSPLASDTPGDRGLEGTQTPTLTLEKRAPSEVSVGQASPWKIIVRNVGNVTAHGVVVTDRVPQGTKLVDASPEFTETTDGALAWQLGDLEPGDEAQVSIELMPLVEGEIGSVAQVTFRAQASVRTVSTKPELVVKHTGPEKVLIGEDVVFEITLSNPGSGATTGIVLEEDVPLGLAHVAGEKLEYEVGTLRPKEEKRLQLILRADKAGIVKNVLRVTADAGLEATDQITLEVIAPQLQVAISGPRTRYLERQVTYEVAVANPGTSTAYDIQLVTFLPKGLKYVSADNKGSYDAGRHAVYWSLAELAAEESGGVQLTALPIETGEQKLRVEGTANLDLSAKFEHTTNVQALTELAFTVQDVHDPIEVGSETMYEIRIVNNGNTVATNVQIAAALPEQLTPIKGEGPTKVIVEGQQVFMEPLARIAPRDEVVYRIAAKGVGAGDHVIAVQLASDESPTPVTKQESTKVYADQ